MRDVERLREKIQISLDDRQVWALGFSALLLLAGVFMVGMLVGRRTAPPPPPAASDLAVLDEAAKPAKPAPEPPPKPAEKPAPEPVAEKEPEPAAEKEKEKPAQGRAPTVVAPPQKALVVPPPPRPVTVASVAPVTLTPPPHDLGDYTVQIGASQERSEAQRLEAKARGAGLKPYVVEVNLGAKGTWYRVRVGSFKDKDAAARYRKDVERELRSAAVVMPTH